MSRVTVARHWPILNDAATSEAKGAFRAFRLPHGMVWGGRIAKH